jgi:hypothetical protein
MVKTNVRIFKNKWFVRFARKEGLNDEKLCQAVKEAEQGSIDADYGGGVIKQRVSRPNEGKSGGYRVIILYRKGDKAFFVFGFSKSAQNNLSVEEIKAFKDAAKTTLAFTESGLKRLIETGGLKEVFCHD